MFRVIYYVFGRKTTLLGVLLTVLMKASAQQDVSFAHYWALESSFNPAAIGKTSLINVTGAYAMSMAGFENNPKTMFVAGDMPFYFMNGYHGVGLQLMSDDIGLFKHQHLTAQYAYKLSLLGGTLSIGLQASMLSEKFKGSELDLREDDPALEKTDVTGTALDLAAGLYFQHRNWYAGLSVQHAMEPSVDLGEKAIIDVARTYYFTGGYNIRLHNPFFTIHTSVLARTDGVGYRVDVTARVKYSYEKRLLYAGVAYSPTNSVTALIRGQLPRHQYRLQLRGLHVGTQLQARKS